MVDLDGSQAEEVLLSAASEIRLDKGLGRERRSKAADPFRLYSTDEGFTDGLPFRNSPHLNERVQGSSLGLTHKSCR
jgi:hypothetical protein